MASNQTDRLGDTLTNKNSPTKSPSYSLQKGTVTDFDVSSGTASVLFKGATISGVPSNSNYVPQIGDVVWMDVNGNSTPRITDRAGDYGPSVFAGIQTGSITSNESRGATGYGDLGTPGPSVSVVVSASGLLYVTISCEISATSDNDGGAVGVALGGANTVSPADDKAFKFFPGFVNALCQGSRTVLFTGLNPGLTSVTLKYRDLFDAGTDVFYANREVIAIPM